MTLSEIVRLNHARGAFSAPAGLSFKALSASTARRLPDRAILCRCQLPNQGAGFIQLDAVPASTNAARTLVAFFHDRPGFVVLGNALPLHHRLTRMGAGPVSAIQHVGETLQHGEATRLRSPRCRGGHGLHDRFENSTIPRPQPSKRAQKPGPDSYSFWNRTKPIGRAPFR